LLNDINFTWSDKQGWKWREQYDKLVSFKEEHGHCKVPGSYKDKVLAIWVRGQRTQYTGVKGAGEIENSRVKLLNEALHGEFMGMTLCQEDQFLNLRHMLVPQRYSLSPHSGFGCRGCEDSIKNGSLIKNVLPNLMKWNKYVQALPT
jgi:hypothetical protein